MPGGEAYLSALGAFSIHYNEAEMALWTFFQIFIENPSARSFLFHHLHNRHRVDLIRIFAGDGEDDGLHQSIEYGLNCFDRICENRNILLHAFADNAEESDPAKIRLLKRSTTKPGQMNRYDAPIEVVRKNAVAAENAKWFFFGLHHYVSERRALGRPILIGDALPALPPRPPIPDKLSLSRPLEDRSAAPPPPQSEKG